MMPERVSDQYVRVVLMCAIVTANETWHKSQ